MPTEFFTKDKKVRPISESKGGLHSSQIKSGKPPKEIKDREKNRRSRFGLAKINIFKKHKDKQDLEKFANQIKKKNDQRIKKHDEAMKKIQDVLASNASDIETRDKLQNIRNSSMKYLSPDEQQDLNDGIKSLQKSASDQQPNLPITTEKTEEVHAEPEPEPEPEVQEEPEPIPTHILTGKAPSAKAFAKANKIRQKHAEKQQKRTDKEHVKEAKDEVNKENAEEHLAKIGTREKVALLQARPKTTEGS